MSLSECVSGLPHAPGVYIFHGDGGLPLYIGKSIDIRARVKTLSPLFNQRLRRLKTLCSLQLTSEASGCFGRQTGQCAGACTGDEPRHAHDQRLQDVLQEPQIHTWPFAGAIDLLEQRGEWIQKHRVMNWCYLGSWYSDNRSHQPMSSTSQVFDADTYQILVKPILIGQVEIQPIPPEIN